MRNSPVRQKHGEKGVSSKTKVFSLVWVGERIGNGDGDYNFLITHINLA